MAAKTKTTEPKFEKGDVVDTLEPTPRRGIIRFVGKVPGRLNEMAGIELEKDARDGCDGCFDKIRYFQCPPKRGKFLKTTQIRKNRPADDPRKKPSRSTFDVKHSSLSTEGGTAAVRSDELGAALLADEACKLLLTLQASSKETAAAILEHLTPMVGNLGGLLTVVSASSTADVDVQVAASTTDAESQCETASTADFGVEVAASTTDVGVQVAAAASSEMDTAASAQMDAAASAQIDAEAEAQIDAEAEAQIDAEAEAQIDAEAEAQIDAEAEAQIDAAQMDAAAAAQMDAADTASTFDDNIFDLTGREFLEAAAEVLWEASERIGRANTRAPYPNAIGLFKEFLEYKLDNPDLTGITPTSAEMNPERPSAVRTAYYIVKGLLTEKEDVYKMKQKEGIVERV
ncbi:uncharacterized protein [Oscarella lobularis]|uniref:uncharacterized protein n=1 Tax=Oscarella lobularis TaxID=121494 RepID=UPI003313FFDA